MENNELNLINKCIKGKYDAQKALYEKYKTRWFIICLRYAPNKMEAEDILQDGLISVFKDIHQFDSNKGQFAHWSNRIMVNAALQYLRKWKKITFEYNLENYHSKIDDSQNIYDIIGEKELTHIIQQLPSGYRVVFNMYVIEGFKHREIAEKLAITEGTSKSQLAKAKKMLRKRLEFILQN